MKRFIIKYYNVFIVVYTMWMIYLLFFISFRDAPINPYEIRTKPFETIIFFTKEVMRYNPFEVFENIIGNIILFIPYGFIGISFPKLRNGFLLMLSFFVSINVIEFSQYYLNRGTADIDDVILNSLGVFIGFVFYKCFFLNKA